MTAEEFFNQWLNDDTFENDTYIDVMIRFAAHHVQLAKEKIAEEAMVRMKEGMDFYYEDYVEGVDKESILNAYSLTNIK